MTDLPIDQAAPPGNLVAGRRPSQKRGQARVDALLEAADKLLLVRDANDIGLYDVAHLAGVPPTSAYHFFPTKESVLLALAKKYLAKLRADMDAPLDMSSIERWPELIAQWYGRTVAFFNDSLSARKLIIGSAVGSEIKTLDIADIAGHASRMREALERVFDMPYVKDPEFKYTVLIAIYDGVWMSSYAQHGYIAPGFAREGLAAGLAYLETFLPKTIPLRDPKLQELRALSAATVAPAEPPRRTQSPPNPRPAKTARKAVAEL